MLHSLDPVAVRVGSIGRWIPLLLFSLVAVVHGLSPVVQSGDSQLNVAQAYSIWFDHSLALNSFPEFSERFDTTVIDGELYWTFPWASALPMVPVVAVLGVFGIDVREQAITSPWVLEQPLASCLVAASTVLLFHVARTVFRAGGARRDLYSLVAALAFAFGTSAWSTASRAMWSQTTSLLLISCVLYLLTRPMWTFFRVCSIGLVVGAAYCVRPTNALSVVGVGILMLVVHRRRLLPLFLGGCVSIGLFVLVNVATFREIIPAYYNATRLGFWPTTLEALAGDMVSPSRGLLPYTPVVLVVTIVIFRLVRGRRVDSLSVMILGVLAAHWAVLALFPHWWGGVSYGPRFFTELTPFLFYLVVSFIAFDLPAFRARRIRRALAWFVLASVTVGVFNSASGATLRASLCWNATPVHVDKDPGRVWDWTDPQMLRGVRDAREFGLMHAVTSVDCFEEG